MPRVRLIHWNADEAKLSAGRLETDDYEVVYEPLDPPASLHDMRNDPPAAVVIDLSRLPMQGRDMALAIRHYKATRSVPIIFVAGDPEKVVRVKKTLPDAVYTTWEQIKTALREAVASPPLVTTAPRSLLAGYADTPLCKKLGVEPYTVLALIDAPPTFEDLLGDLPEGVKLRRQTKGKRNLTIWFTRSRQELEQGIERMALFAQQGPLWIAWPKKASPLGSDLTQAVVRKAGLAIGLVDYKVCAIDAIWSGLLFTRRDGIE
jgi:CheY-like chemotaxis protein